MFIATRMAQKSALSHSLRGGLRSTTLATTQAAFSFSEETKPAEEAKAEPSAAEQEANRSEWGIKYDDECL